MAEIKNVILSDQGEIREKFLAHFKKEALDLADSLEDMHKKLQNFDKIIEGHRQKALVECIFYNIINNVFAAINLLLTGFLIPSGNLMRQSIESLCLAIVCSRGDFDYLEKILKNELYTFKATKIVLTDPSKFGITESGANALKKHREYYHKSSHPTLFAIASQFDFSQEGAYQIGPFFDVSKMESYKRELRSIYNFLMVLPNAFDGLLQNAVWIDKNHMDQLWKCVTLTTST
jgi:hypothetical protein